MPNWCSNKLTLISADQDKIDEILEFVKVDTKRHDLEKIGIGSFDFNKIVPEPTLANTDDWYWWRVKNWGTKWNASSCDYIYDDQCFTFETAWAPPEPVIKVLAKRFPEVKFILIYAELGMGFAGSSEYECGRLILEEYFDIGHDPEASDICEELFGRNQREYDDDYLEDGDGYGYEGLGLVEVA